MEEPADDVVSMDEDPNSEREDVGSAVILCLLGNASQLRPLSY